MAQPSRLQRRMRGEVPKAPRIFTGWNAENDARIAALPKAAKGVKGENCNVTACQRPGAWFYNTGTRAYYCRQCAQDIARWNNPAEDGYTLFPNMEAERADWAAWMENKMTPGLRQLREEKRERLAALGKTRPGP